MQVTVFVERGTAIMVPDRFEPTTEMRRLYPGAVPWCVAELDDSAPVVESLARHLFAALPMSEARVLLGQAPPR
jgi:hypothetical protein